MKEITDIGDVAKYDLPEVGSVLFEATIVAAMLHSYCAFVHSLHVGVKHVGVK